MYSCDFTSSLSRLRVAATDRDYLAAGRPWLPCRRRSRPASRARPQELKENSHEEIVRRAGDELIRHFALAGMRRVERSLEKDEACLDRLRAGVR